MAGPLLIALVLGFWVANAAHRYLHAEHHGADAFLTLVQDGGSGGPLLYLTAGFLLASIGVMGPCLLQMSLVLAAGLAGLSARAAAEALPPIPLKRAGLRFGAGYLAVYVPIGLTLGVAGEALAAWAPVFKAAGGLLVLALGLSLLHVLPRSWLAACRGPLWLIRTGRASLRRPFAAGVAFAIYCVGCCGPYLYALALLAGASGSWWAGAGLVLLFATAMGLPLVLPALSYPLAYRSAERLQVRSAGLARLAGTLLVGLGTLLVLEQPALRLLGLG